MSVKNIVHEIETSTIDIILEVLDIENYYHFEHGRKNMWTFYDRTGLKHFIVIGKDLDDAELNVMEIKFGWLHNDKPRYDKSKSHDEKVFNTHLYILFNELLPYFYKYDLSYNLKPTDKYRYRLYRIAINKYINKKEYELITNDEILTINKL